MIWAASTPLGVVGSRRVSLKLDPAPARGEGLNTWMFRTAAFLARQRVVQSEALAFIAEQAGADAKPGEIERQVKEGYRRAFENCGSRGVQRAFPSSGPCHSRWPERNDELIRMTVEECPATLTDLWEASPIRPDEKRHPVDILADLHGAHGEELLCMAPAPAFGFETRSFNHWAQAVRGEASSSSGRRVKDWEMVVPNLMSAPTGRTLDGRQDRPRTKANACDQDSMKFAVVEVDIREDDPLCRSLSRHPLEIGASVIMGRLDLAKVRMVVMSGSKSLHAWVDVAGMNAASVAGFFRSLSPLAVDWRGSLPEQQFRLPNGFRADRQAQQSVIYWNPTV
jgi:hypothetical protein